MNWISRAFWASFTFLAAVASNVYGNKDNTLSIVKILTPKFVEGYKSVMLLGANIECSMLYKCWTDLYNVKFKPHAGITSTLRYATHSNGNRLSIKYLSEIGFSKKQRNTPINEVVNGFQCATVGVKLAQLAIFELNSPDFLYIVNNDFDDTLLQNAGGTKAKVISHGSNEYSGYHKIYFSAALNKSNNYLRVLSALGFDNDFIKRSNVVETAYQCLMRTSLRDIDCTEDVIFIYNDKFIAMAISEIFQNCTVSATDSLILKKLPYDSVDKNRRSKAKDLFKANVTEFSVMDFTTFLKKLSNNNIVRSDEY